MNRIIPILAAAALALPAAGTLAAEQAEPRTDAKSAGAKPANSAEWDKRWAQMQENMTKMYDLMARTQKTTDGAERQKLLAEHWQLMQQNMESMRGFGGPMMMGAWGPGAGRGPGMMGGAGYGYGKGPGMMGGGPGRGGPLIGMTDRQREEFLQRRLDAMQIMMEQMLMRQQYAPAAPVR